MYDQYQDMPPPSYPMPQMGGGMQHATESSLHYQIDVEEILQDIQHTLRSEELLFNPKSNQVEWKVPEGVLPIVNQIGVNSILMTLRSRLTKIFILSDLEDSAIEGITMNIGNNLIDNIYYNWELWGIKDDAAATQILHLVTDTVFATMCKARNANYLKFLRSIQTIQDVQHRTYNQKPQGEGGSSILDKLLKRRK